MRNILLTGAFCTLIFMPFSASAGPILRTGEIVSVDATQELGGDFYGFGSQVIISGAAQNDAYLGGGTVTVNAPIAEDLTVAGGVIQVHGDVGDDVRVVGGEVTIAKPVKGDVVVLGGVLTILSTATVEGDVLFFGNQLTVDGVVTGSVHGTAETIRLNAPVHGDVSVQATNQFTIGDSAQLKGTVTYTSPNEAVRAQGAVLDGEMQRLQTATPEPDTRSVVRIVLLMLGTLGFAALALFVVGKKYVERIVEHSTVRTGVSGLIGLGMFIAIPLVCLMLGASVIGGFVAILLFLMYLISILLAVALSPIFIGHVCERIILKRKTLTVFTIMGGVLLFFGVLVIPFVGIVCVISSVIITLGSLGVIVYRSVRAG